MERIIGVGDNVCDVYLHENCMYPGGQALNVAVYSRLLGARSAYLGVFGTDAVGAHVQKVLDELGVEHSRCRVCPGENGYALVELADGDRIFRGSNKGGVLRQNPLKLTEEDLGYLSGFRVLHTSNNSYFDSSLPQARKAVACISYDFSRQWTGEDKLRDVCPWIDVAFLSCGDLPLEEAEALCGTIQSYGCRTAVATLGGRGALIRSGAQRHFQRADTVHAVDTLGAGDSFCAAFLCARELEGRTLTASAESAARFSARTCLCRGAFGHGAPAVWPLSEIKEQP